MKRLAFSFCFLFFVLLTNAWGAPLEFYATVTEKSPVDSLNTTLKVEVTPTVVLDVAVTTVTELKDADGNPITIDEIQVLDTVEVEAVFTPGGFLALEIQLQEAGEGFSIKGYLEDIDEVDSSLSVQGLTILTDGNTRFRDEERDPLSLDDLELRLASEGPLSLLIKVDGVYTENGLLATRVQILPNDRFARISLEGVIYEVRSETQFILDIGGGTQALVNILPETVMVGDPLAGLYVRVIGQLAPDLSVNALRIRVVGLFELSPDEVEMGYSETREITVLLRQSLDSNLVLQLSSADPAVASVSPESLTIPAGVLSAAFQVTSGEADGRTAVTVSAGDAFGGFSRNLRVEVGEGSGEQPTEIQWTPSVIRAAPDGHVSARLMFKYGRADQDLTVALDLIGPSADLNLQYPPTATILQGEKEVRIDLLFGAQTGSGKLVATLPEGMGSGTAELDIDLRSNPQAPLKVDWSTKKVDVAPETDFTVSLRLSRTAEADVPIIITPVSGDRTVLSEMEAQALIPAGSQTVEVAFRSSGRTGRVKLRAALPRELGGGHADLDISVR